MAVGAFGLTRLLGQPNPSVTLPLTVTTTSQTLLTSNAALNTHIQAIPDGNSVVVTAPSTIAEAYYCPIYDPQSKLVGPGPAWNGTIDSGETPPTPAAITNAPSAFLITPQFQRFSGQLVVGIRAEAAGGSPAGIASVVLHCEGNGGVTQTTRSKYYFKDANGKWVGYMAHWFTLDATRFISQVPNRPGQGYWEANVYAIITANDGTMEVLQIGAPASTATDNRQKVFRFYPDVTDYDGPLLTVSASGFGDVGTTFEGVSYSGVAANYTTITAALNAHSAAGRLAPRILVIGSGNYNSEVTGNAYGGVKGYCIVTHSSSVVAVIGFANIATWATWRPNFTGIRFMGSGIQFDYKFYQGIFMASAADPPYWFDGITAGCPSVNLQTHVTWDGGAGGGILVNELNGTSPTRTLQNHIVTECAMQYVTIGGAFLVRGGVHQNMCAGDCYDQTTCIIGNINIASSANQMRNSIPTLDAIYTGAGTVATMSNTAQGSNGHLRLTVDGVNTDSPSPFSTYTTQGGSTTADLAAWISTQPGWTGSVHAGVTPGDNLTDRTPVNFPTGSSANCKGVVGTLSTNLQNLIHMDYNQWQSHSHGDMINRTIVDNRMFGSAGIQMQFWDSNGFGYNEVNNFFDCSSVCPPSAIQCQIGTAGPNTYNGCSVSSSTISLINFLLKYSDTGGANPNTYDAWCRFTNSVWSGQTTTGTVGSPPVLTNNHWAGGGYPVGSPSSRSGDTGGTGTPDGTALYPNTLTYNSSPAIGSGLLSDFLVAPIDAYDAIGATRQNPDVKGARAMRLTSRTITGAQAKTLALDTVLQSVGSNVAQLALTYKTGPGNTGLNKTVTINLSIAA